PRFGSCCLQGKVRLPHPLSPPPLLHRLLTVHSHSPHESDAFKIKAREFCKHIRRYNAALAFVSCGIRAQDGFVNHMNQPVPGAGPYTFRVHGQFYHRIGSLLPQQGQQPKYAQLYIYDPHDDAARCQMNQFRIDRNADQDPQLMLDLHDMMVEHNPWVQVYRNGHERMQHTPPDQHDLPLRIHIDIQQDQWCYNAPVVDEIAAIIPGDGTDVDNTRDIILHRVIPLLQRISEIHPAYTPLHYVLLFP
ncbi:uncharacterized protein EI90DRAFT_2894303, partial [Cantharellus anzutake]|uniref:uncharacterized protein n=1 Tax=Cantharellus anzutake TaxID=1750568 RepID=UPI00190356E6